MSLDLESYLPSTADSPRRHLKPLILVERSKGLLIQRGGSSAVCRPSQEEPLVPAQAVDFPRKVIVDNPNPLFWARSEDALPTPPRTPTLSSDSHEDERGRSNSVLRYHLPFRAIRLSSSRDPGQGVKEQTVLNTQHPDASMNSRCSVEESQLDSNTVIGLSEKPTVRFRDSIPPSSPRPLSRMSWYSNATTSSEKTITVPSLPWAFNSTPSHHHRSHSVGNGQSRISLDSRGSSGTFGVGLKGSSHSVLGQDSVVEVGEEDPEDVRAGEGAVAINNQDEFDVLTRTVTSSKSLHAVLDTPPFSRPAMKRLFPVQTAVKGEGKSSITLADAQLFPFKFPSFPPSSSIQTVRSAHASNPNMRTAISAPAAPECSSRDFTVTPTRHRVLSLPTSTPAAGPTETGVLSKLGGQDPVADSLVPLPFHSTTSDPKPRRVLRKSTSPLIPAMTPTSNPNTISSTRTIHPPHRQHGGSLPTDDLLREVILHRESAATFDTITTGDTATSIGTTTSKRLRLRKSIGNLFSRLFIERRGPRGGSNAT